MSKKSQQFSANVPRSPGTYSLVCLPTGDTYVGGTANLYRRACNHWCKMANGTATARIRSLVEIHGIKSFRFNVLQECDVSELGRLEWEAKLKLRPTLNHASEKWNGANYSGVNKATVSCQLEYRDHKSLDSLESQTGRSRSYVVRAAVLLLIKSHRDGKIDWGKSPRLWV